MISAVADNRRLYRGIQLKLGSGPVGVSAGSAGTMHRAAIALVPRSPCLEGSTSGSRYRKALTE